MTDFSNEETFNGANCKTYCWSQSHSDIEIRVKLNNNVKYENINVDITNNSIKVEIFQKQLNSSFCISPISSNDLDDNAKLSNNICDNNKLNKKCILEGKFENLINTDSIFWLLDSEETSIVIYLDKKEDKWWKELLLNEEVAQLGPKHYTIQMEHLDDGSRMVVDKLIVEQRNKLSI